MYINSKKDSFFNENKIIRTLTHCRYIIKHSAFRQENAEQNRILTNYKSRIVIII